MGAVLFYHLTRRPLEHTLRQLLERALAGGMRVAVRGTDEERLRDLDDALWACPRSRSCRMAWPAAGATRASP